MFQNVNKFISNLKLTGLILALGLGVGRAQTNDTPHLWHQKGNAIAGDYVSAGTSSLVIKQNGTNRFLALASLDADDQKYLRGIKRADKRKTLAAEAAMLPSQGYVEVTSQLLENFPEKVNYQKVWMDCQFWKFSPYSAIGETAPDVILVLNVLDKNRDVYDHCEIFKNMSSDNYVTSQPNPVAGALASLKPDDRIRLFGIGHNPGTGFNQFEIQSFEIIQTADDAKQEKLDTAPKDVFSGN